MNLELRRKEIESRLTEIRGLVDNETDIAKLETLETETSELQEERTMIDKKMAIATKTEVKPIIIDNRNQMDKEKLEKRAANLRENRVIQVSSEEILLPEHTAFGLAPVPFAQVSTLVDRVNVINLNGGETYKKSFVKSNGTAGTTLEGQPYSETEPAFGYLTISKVKITAYTEITEELEKLPAIPYQAEVLRNINISLKKKISEQILRGAGTTNTFTGIFSDAALNNSNPLRINVDHVSRVVAEALVSVKNKRLIRLIVNYETSVTAQIENFKGSSFISIVANVSSISSNLNKAICRRANSQVSCRARMLMSDLIRNIANPMISELIDCVGNIQSEMEKGIVLHADSFTENLMQQESVMIKSKIAKMQSRVEMTSDNEADVEKLLIRLLSFTETYKAEIESSMASLNSMIQESDISSIFTDDLRLEIYSAGESMGVRETFILNNQSRLEALNYGEDYFKTRTVYQTFFDSELASVEPCLVNIEESFVDTCDARIETLDAEQTLKINANAFSTILNTNISIVNLEPLIGTIEHDALLFADITFDPSSWHNPVQINDVLEIYQVYEGEQEGMNLNLG